MKKWVIFGFIIILASVLRLYKLNSVPPSLSHDEVAIAYNAYSILKTGKDEYGNPFPLLFKSFDDYKLPAMVYASVPTVWLFGLNEWGTRLPSATFGILSVVVFYLLSGVWREEHETRKKTVYPWYSQHLMTVFFAISIWHINFSRQSFESNGAVLFLMLGVLGLLKFQTDRRWLILSAMAFAIAIYFYYSVRIVIPVLLLIYALTNVKLLIQYKKYTIVSIVLFLLTLTPLIPSMFSEGGLARISMVGVTNDTLYIQRLDTYSRIYAQNPTIINRFIYNRRIALVQTIIDNYVKNILPSHVYLTATVNNGLAYIFEAPLMLIGVFVILIKHKKTDVIFLTWLCITPLIGGLSTNQPNALRTLPNAPMFSMLSAIGTVSIFQFLKTKQRIVFLTILAVTIYFGVSKFYSTYLFVTPKQTAISFGDGYKQMAQYIEKHYNEFDNFVISGYLWRPYIFMLFHTKYPPNKYQAHGNKHAFDKFIFGNASWDKEGLDLSDPTQDLTKLTDGKTAYILSKTEYSVHAKYLKILEKIQGVHANDVFIVVTN